jgi:hypothetical protein
MRENSPMHGWKRVLTVGGHQRAPIVSIALLSPRGVGIVDEAYGGDLNDVLERHDDPALSQHADGTLRSRDKHETRVTKAAAAAAARQVHYS